MHDADEQGISDASFCILVELILRFVEHNKQAIRYTLSQLPENSSSVFASRFTVAKFLASLVFSSKEGEQEGKEEVVSTRYTQPLATYLQNLFSQELTRCELRDKLELIINYEEAEWLANSLWLSFVEKIREAVPSLTGLESA